MKPQPYELEALNQTELAYAAQEAIGVPYRRPIIRIKPALSVTPVMLRDLWAEFLAQRQPLFSPVASVFSWETKTLRDTWERSPCHA